MKSNFGKTLQLLKQANTVAIAGHIRPDGDSIGSSMALRYALLGMGKKAVDVFTDDSIPDNFDYLHDFDKIRDSKYIDNNPWREYDLFIILDSSTEDRIGKCTQLRAHAKKVLVIDHHQNTRIEGDEVVTNSQRAATGEMLYELFTENNIEINRDIATALYTAMATDTGCFVHVNTTSYAHRAAAELIDKGIDLNAINYNNFKVYNRNIIPGLAYALRNMKFFLNDQAAVVYTPLKIIKKHNLGEIHQFKKFASEADGVRVGVIVAERQKGVFNVSLRSHGNVNVAAVAEHFGGGGHKNASGFIITGKYKKVLKDILEQVAESLA